MGREGRGLTGRLTKRIVNLEGVCVCVYWRETKRQAEKKFQNQKAPGD